MVYGERDKVNGQVYWRAHGITPTMAKLYRAAGCELVAWYWVPSIKDWRAKMSFVGESWPQVEEPQK